VLFAMICVPKLRGDPELFSLNNIFIKCTLDTFADFFLIAIITSGIEASVPYLNSIIDNLVTDIIWDFPKTEPHCWHSIPRGKS